MASIRAPGHRFLPSKNVLNDVIAWGGQFEAFPNTVKGQPSTVSLLALMNPVIDGDSLAVTGFADAHVAV